MAAHDLIEDYLRRLDAALGDLPRERRVEILEEIREHLHVAVAESGGDELAVRNAMERLGDPQDIAADARARFGVPTRRAGTREVLALVLLLVGGFFAGIGWVVGVVCLWTSTMWRTRDKILGTLLLPFGLAASVVFFGLAAVIPVSCGATGSAVTVSVQVSPVASRAAGPSVAPDVAGPSPTGSATASQQPATGHVESAAQSCSSGGVDAGRVAVLTALAVVALSPLGMTAYLGWRLRRPPPLPDYEV